MSGLEGWPQPGRGRVPQVASSGHVIHVEHYMVNELRPINKGISYLHSLSHLLRGGQPTLGTYSCHLETPQLTMSPLAGLAGQCCGQTEAGGEWGMRSAGESVGVKPRTWLKFKFRLWLQRLSLTDSHLLWTKHLTVFFDQPLIMASGPQCPQKQHLGLFCHMIAQAEPPIPLATAVGSGRARGLELASGLDGRVWN